MNVKPVGNWLLLGESKVAEKEMAEGESLIIMPDTANSMSTIIVAEILDVGPNVPKFSSHTGDPLGAEGYNVGDIVIFRENSPSMERIMANGEQLILLPEPHVIAKWVSKSKKPEAEA